MFRILTSIRMMHKNTVLPAAGSVFFLFAASLLRIKLITKLRDVLLKIMPWDAIPKSCADIFQDVSRKYCLQYPEIIRRNFVSDNSEFSDSRFRIAPERSYGINLNTSCGYHFPFKGQKPPPIAKEIQPPGWGGGI